MFLAGLSDDVNRTTVKPYRELKDSESRPDEEVALEYWQSHCLRERSAVAALFSGQFCSTLKCQRCGYTNKSFEAFSFLPIPIPEHDYRWITCMVVMATRSEPDRRMIRICARVPKRGAVKDLLEVAAGMLSVEVADLVLADVGQGYVYRLWNEEKRLSVLSDDARPWIFHSPAVEVARSTSKKSAVQSPPTPSSSSTRRSPSKSRLRQADPSVPDKEVIVHLVHRRLRTVQRYFYNPYKSELFATPVTLKLPNRCPTSKLYLTVWMTVRHLVPDLAESAEDWPFSLSTVKRDGTACAYCSWRQGCLGCTVPASQEEEVYLTAEETLGIDWDAYILQSHFKEKLAGHVHDHESVNLAMEERKTSVSLTQCVSGLVQDEELQVFCRECTKKAQGEFTESPHVKSLTFWALPPLLVLQLKRFNSNGGVYYKLFNEVTFQQGFELKDFLCGGSKDCHKTPAFVDWHRPLRERSLSDEMRSWVGFPSLSREITSYVLYGVVNHIGGMGSGHYTACILHDKQWFCFNDDRVYTISEQDVCTANAYLLFYARADVANRETGFQEIFPDEGRKADPVDREAVRKSAWASEQDRQTSKNSSLAGSGERFCHVM